METTTADGKTDSFYADVEAITGELAVQTIENGLLVPKTKDAPPSDPDWYGLDFAVAPVGTEPVFPERQENPSDSCSGFFAHLKQRAIAVWGPTPEEATRRLIGYVAALTAAGCLDHTGEPALTHNQRRYQMVFGEPGAEQLSRQLQRVPLSTTS